MKSPRRRRSPAKKKAKPVKLSPSHWVRNAEDIKKYRESKLIEQDYRCAISGIPLNGSNSVVDHTHSNGAGADGRCRGVILSELNTLEGKFLRQFKRLRMKDKYGLDFAETLINMGEYLQKDNSKEPLHHAFMSEWRSYIERLTKDEIRLRLKRDLNITEEDTMTHRDLVHRYIQAWVDKIEESLAK